MTQPLPNPSVACYGRTEKLKLQRHIDTLFAEGKSVRVGALRLIYVPCNLADSPIKFGVSVPKKFHRRAVHRNRLKRLLRECYRLNKHRLYPHVGQGQLMMLVYQSAEMAQFEALQVQMRQLMDIWLAKQSSIPQL